jgi:hypothetical protein
LEAASACRRSNGSRSQTRLRTSAANPKVQPFGMENVNRLFCREKLFLELGNIARLGEFYILLEQNHKPKELERRP